MNDEPLNVASHRGIISYEPQELVVRVRAGTPLCELEETLADAGQMLAFEPPRMGAASTIGGCVATGLSGPRRAYAGSVRDFMLGATIIDGQGRCLSFGGQVMKNVAGYDVSRLMAGAMGTLGVILDVSVKVLPMPAREVTIVRTAPLADAVGHWRDAARRFLPVTATAWTGGRSYVRLAGDGAAIDEGVDAIEGDVTTDGPWDLVRDQRHPAVVGAEHLWRLSVAKNDVDPLSVLVEWGGAQCWRTDGADPRASLESGHATRFRGESDAERFQPLAPVVQRLHQRLKDKFDPARILNAGRMYPDL
jgi:glycolate oxidase FAD binding subunit